MKKSRDGDKKLTQNMVLDCTWERREELIRAEEYVKSLMEA